MILCYAFFFYLAGNSTDSVFAPKAPKKVGDEDAYLSAVTDIPIGSRKRKRKRKFDANLITKEHASSHNHHSNIFTRRRHAADETAFILAKAIIAGVRTISFCKTRCLVEWVYERTINILKSNPETEDLASKVESYRGGYTAEARRSIEERLFNRKLVAVVGTNALELGVDVGGVDLTLHTGYPGGLSSLLQQAGRAGRGKLQNKPSCAIMVCFSAPSEQFIWKNPKSLLSKAGVDTPAALPINGTVIQGHLLCAGEEFPLTGNKPVSCLLNEVGVESTCFDADCRLLAPTKEAYNDNVEYLAKKGLMTPKQVSVVSGKKRNKKSDGVHKISVHSTHPVSLLMHWCTPK